MAGNGEAPGMRYSVVVPELQVGFNLFCTSCTWVNQYCVLRKPETCDFGHPVMLRGVIDGLYFLCPRCDVVISREMQFCYRCRRPNAEYSCYARKEYTAFIEQWCETHVPSLTGSSCVLGTRPFSPVVRAIVTRAASTPIVGSAAMANFQRGLDLYCTHCAKNISVNALHEPNMAPCGHSFPIPGEMDWLYRRCCFCNVVISDEMEFCYRCQSRNTHYIETARYVRSLCVLEDYRDRKQDLTKDADVLSEDAPGGSDFKIFPNSASIVATGQTAGVLRCVDIVTGADGMDSVAADDNTVMSGELPTPSKPSGIQVEGNAKDAKDFDEQLIIFEQLS